MEVGGWRGGGRDGEGGGGAGVGRLECVGR